MEYESILEKIEQDQKNEMAIDLYHYNGLMQAIDFFSNRLNLEQIIASAFEFVNELLTVSASAIFMLKNSGYILYTQRGLKPEIIEYPTNQKLASFAVFCGTVIHERKKLEEYFSKELLDHYRVQMMIPLIVDVTLEGFIFLSEKNIGQFVLNDVIICETLMRVFNNAFENYRSLEKLKHTNRELDEKIFTLFAINQASKILLTEHSLDALYTLSLDVFSELTQSSHTGFFLYDEGAEKYVLKAYKDIYQSKVNKKSVVLTRNMDMPVDPMRELIDISRPADVEYFNQLFREGIDILSFSQPVYIILLMKQSEILGFVCLSNTVSGISYKDSIFELVESLASYTYIALSNAILLKKLEEGRKLLQEKLDRLLSLNILMKNVNSAEDMETLQQLIMRTLEISFGVEKGALTLFQPQDQSMVVVSEVGTSLKSQRIQMNSSWERLYRGSVILETDEDNVYRYLGKEINDAIGEKAGLLAVPICVEKDESIFFGALLIFQFRNGLLSDEENRVVMETIANLSAPLLKNFMDLEYERGALVIDQREAFCRELKKQTAECAALKIPFHVIHIETRTRLFQENHLASRVKEKLEGVYPVAYNHILIPVIQDFQYYRDEVMKMAEQDGSKVTIYRFGEDFNSFDDFIEHFNETNQEAPTSSGGGSTSHQ